MAGARLRRDGAASAHRCLRGAAWGVAGVLAAALAAIVVGGPLAEAWRGRRPLDPVAFWIGPVGVRWYGLLIALSFVPAWLVAQPERVRAGLAADDLVDLALLGIPLGLVGARLGYVLQNLDYFALHPLDMLRTRMGGLSIHGVLVGAALAILWLARRRRLDAAVLADVVAPSMLLAQAIGRWGNFFNREVLGYPTERPWGLYVPEAMRPPGYEAAAYFHPAFLYESILALVGVVGLLAYRRRVRRRPGELAALYLVVYSTVRWGVEWVRIGEPLAMGMTLAQWVSLGGVAVGAAWWVWLRRQARAAMVE